MELIEQKSFITSIHPFEFLSSKELDEFAKNMDVVYFKKDSIIQKTKSNPKYLYFIIKGLVQEVSEDEEVLSVYSQKEMFSSRSAIENYSKNSFKALQECICYALKKEVFTNTLHVNEQLESYFFQTISQKLNKNINYEKNQELSNIMISKVKDAKIQPALIKNMNISIYEAAKSIKKAKASALLLKDENNEYYIVTDSDFRQKVILRRMNFDEKVSLIATKGLIYVYEDDFLFDAQITLSKYGLKRVVVKNKDEKIVGILDQISLSSFFASNTFSISNQIANASSVEELKDASSKFLGMIQRLHVKGVKIEFITKLINQLNQKMLKRLYNILAPKSLQENSCLIVMGSEGRGEQILKTDQDNGIIIKDDFDIGENELREFAKHFTKTLLDFGFPKCDGNVMLSNPFWCKKSKDYKANIYEWVNNPSEESFMNIAIFYDALCVNGDEKILNELKEYLFKSSNSFDNFYRYFAKVINSFDIPLGFFDGFVYEKDEHKNELNLKKGGIFIIVHGIRSLSLEHKIIQTNTIERIKELEKLHVFEKEFTNELIMAFNFLQNLKLKSQLDKLNQKMKIDNYINPNNLTMMEKDLLKDSFKIVSSLKKQITHRFRLNYV